MLDKYIDPPCDIWEEEKADDLYWVDDLYEQWRSRDEEIALHNYECKIYNELDRRIIR